MKTWAVMVLVLCLAVLPSLVQAMASQNTDKWINIWSESATGIRNEDNCSTLLTDMPTMVTACTSTYASICIAVNGSINVTRGGTGNLTNFSINGCELRLNQTKTDGSSNLTSWGNLTILKSNVTSNMTGKKMSINIRGGNFTMTDSYVNECGAAGSVYCLNDSTPAFITNSTFRNTDGQIGFAAQQSNGTVFDKVWIIPVVSSSQESLMIPLSKSVGNITIKNSYITTHTGGRGISILDNAFNITFINMTVDTNGGNGIVVSKDQNITFINSTFVDSLFLTSGPSSTYLKNCDIKSVAADNQLIYLDSLSTATDGPHIFEDCNISSVRSTPIAASITLTGNSRNVVFLNSTFYRTSGNVTVNLGSQLIRQWYDMVKITTGASVPVKTNATAIFSNQSFLNYSYTTNLTGWIPQFNITAYINESGTLLNYTSYKLDIIDQAHTNFTLAFNNENHMDTSFENIMLTGSIGNMDLIAPTPVNFTNTSNATVFVNASVFTSGVSLSACVAQWCNSTACNNFTVPFYLTSSYYYCGISVNQSASGWFSVSFFANDTGGVGANTTVRNYTKDITAPVVENFSSNVSCIEIPQNINFSWNQTDYNGMINGSTSCNFTNPIGQGFNMSSGSGNMTGYCILDINVSGSVPWNLTVYALDMAGNRFNTTYNFSTFTAGGCSPPGGGGGGGGGGQNGAVCGNGYCERDENQSSCPSDCVVASPNNTYILLPYNGVISRFVAANTTYIEDITVQNPNPNAISVSGYISCDGNDTSCNWLTFLIDNNTEDTAFNFVVAGGTKLSPGMKTFQVIMRTPENISIQNYRALINFKAIGQTKVMSFELVSFEGLGILSFILDILNTGLITIAGFTVTAWMVAALLLGIVAAALVIPGRKK